MERRHGLCCPVVLLLNSFKASILGLTADHRRYHQMDDGPRHTRANGPASSTSGLLAERRVGLTCIAVLRRPGSHRTRRLTGFDLVCVSSGWRRARGAARIRWVDVLKRDLERIGVRWEEAPGNRDGWRMVVRLSNAFMA